jgi:hypothetical protein
MEQLQKQKAASLSVIATSTLTAINLGLKFHNRFKKSLTSLRHFTCFLSPWKLTFWL